MKLLRITMISVLPVLMMGCTGGGDDEIVVTISGSEVGAEAEALKAQIDDFMAANPGFRVELRTTPDAADQRHQLYVQWLNAQASEPDILQLDVIWTAEFAAAGWIRSLDSFHPDTSGFFPAAIEACRWDGQLFALPWFVDVGMLYWRTNLLEAPPSTLDELALQASRAKQHGLPYGLVWQGSRYEGLVCVFLEHITAFGGGILSRAGDVTLHSDPALKALRYMMDATGTFVPRAALTWKEEQTRFAFQNGQALFMRNWPYAYHAMQDTLESAVAGKFSVAPMPRTPLGSPAAALGGAQLAVNARSRNPEAAYTVIEYLTDEEQLLERARVTGQYPPRQSLYDDERLRAYLGAPLEEIRQIIESAVPRPVTPVYTELSEILQVHLHRALTGQVAPETALEEADDEIRALLERVESAGRRE